MNQTEARTFERRSPRHRAILAAHSEQNGCDCEAYRDYFTYKRWAAQGMQVQKGEKGVKLTTFQQREKTDPDTGQVKRWSRPWGFTVFCRHQVKPKGGHDD